MSSSSSSLKFGEGWSRCKGTSPSTSVSFDFLQNPRTHTYMINLNRILDWTMKSRRSQSNAIRICKDWAGEGGQIFRFFEHDYYFNSKELVMVMTLLHSNHLISSDHVERAVLSWREIHTDFEADINEYVEMDDRNVLPLKRNKRKANVDDDAFDPIEFSDEQEEEEEDDDAEDDEEEEFDNEVNTRPMEMDERERMIRLNCDTLASLTAAGTYLMSRDPHQYSRTLEDIDASIVNVTRELQRFVPVGSQQPIQVEDVLEEEQYGDTAVRLNRRVRDLGHSLANLEQHEYRKMLKEVGIRASNLHRQVYGRKPKKVRMMSGGGMTSHFNYYSERTAPRTLDVAIREWFRTREQDRADQARAYAPVLDQAYRGAEDLDAPQKRPRIIQVEEEEDPEFNALVREAEEQPANKEYVPDHAREENMGLFSQFFGGL